MAKVKLRWLRLLRVGEIERRRCEISADVGRLVEVGKSWWWRSMRSDLFFIGGARPRARRMSGSLIDGALERLRLSWVRRGSKGRQKDERCTAKTVTGKGVGCCMWVPEIGSKMRKRVWWNAWVWVVYFRRA